MYAKFDNSGRCHGIVYGDLEPAPEGFKHFPVPDTVIYSIQVEPIMENGEVVGVNILDTLPDVPPTPQTELQMYMEEVSIMLDALAAGLLDEIDNTSSRFDAISMTLLDIMDML
jgi:hypothetical protein